MAHKSKQNQENAVGEWQQSEWINPKLKSNLSAIMSLHPSGLPASQLCREYSKHHGVDLDVRYWDCNSVMEFCALVPEVFTMVRGGEDWMLYSPDKVKYDSECGKTEYGASGCGVILPHTIKKTFGSTCQSNASSNPKMESVIVSRPVLRSGSLQLNKKNANILGPNAKIPWQELPGNVKVGDFLEVVVAEVVSPERFWIQLKGKDTNEALIWLQEKIKAFYEKTFEEYKIQGEDFLSEGMVCVCLHSDGYWYRALVKSFQDMTTVEVFFIDYGNVFKVKKGSLAFLHRKFGKLPGQAFEARLDGIKPAGGRREFSKEATQRFLQLTDVFTDDTEYMGLVAVVRGLGEKLSLWMVETCTNDLPEGIVINKVLVDELFAEEEDVVDVKALLSLPMPEMSRHAIIDFWLDQIQKLNLGTDNSIDDEMQKLNLGTNSIEGELKDQPSLADDRHQDSLQSKVLHSVRMGGLDCHIVIKDGSAWMTSREVSSFIPNWKGRNILPKMLELKRMVVSSVTVTPISDPTLHASLRGALKDENCGEIILYPLQSITQILDLFLQSPGTHLRLALQSQIKNFERIIEQNL